MLGIQKGAARISLSCRHAETLFLTALVLRFSRPRAPDIDRWHIPRIRVNADEVFRAGSADADHGITGMENAAAGRSGRTAAGQARCKTTTRF
jgi:hypothetical protein